MNENRRNAYLKLIYALLSCSNDDELSLILNENQELLDVGLVQMIEPVVVGLVKDDSQDAAEWLKNVATQLLEVLSSQKNITEKVTTNCHQVSKTTYEKYSSFLADILRVSLDGNQQMLYTFFLKNLDKFNDEFIQFFNNWATAFLTKKSISPGKMRNVVVAICNLSTMIQEFPLGNRTINLEIAVSGYEYVLQLYAHNFSPDETAKLQCNLAIAYRNRIYGNKAENIEKAILCYLKTLQIHTHEQFPKYWAMTQMNLGVAYWQRINGDRSYNLEEAIGCFLRALQVYNNEHFALDRALTLDNLALTYHDRVYGDPAENIELAISYQEQAIKVCTREIYPKEWAEIQNNLGLSFYQRLQGNQEKNLERAITCWKNTLQIITLDTFPEIWTLVQNNLGNAYCELSSHKNKAENIEQAILCFYQVLQVITYEFLPEQWTMIQNNFALAYIDRVLGEKIDNIEKAIYHFSQIMLKSIQDCLPIQWAITQTNLGTAYKLRIRENKLNNTKQAIYHYSQALQIFTYETFPQEHADILFSLGGIYQDAQEYHRAYTMLATSIELTEYFGKKILFSEQAKQKLADERRKFYESMIAVCLKLAPEDPSYYAKAFEYVERGKARTLVEFIANRDFYPKGEVSVDVLNKLKYLRREIAAEQRRLDFNERSHFGDIGIFYKEGIQQSNSSWPAPDRTCINTLWQQMEVVLKTIQQIDPGFTLTQRVEPITFEQVQQLIPDTKTIIVEWGITNGKFVSFIISSQNKLPLVWQSSSDNVKALVEWIVWFLNSSYHNHETQWKDSLSNRLTTLSKFLNIDEIVSLIPKTCTQLILIPHSMLHLLPLHALPLADGSSLFDRFKDGIRYAPSCQLLQLVKNQKRSAFKHFFAIQNPTEDLSYADFEVETIRHKFSPYDETLVRTDAKKETLINNNKFHSAHCIHFACHGSFCLRLPYLSALILADAYFLNKNSEKATNVLDCLTLREIFDLDLSKCRLVTLSACQTAMIDYNTVNEYVGLSSGFLYAGSISVVSSLWKVNDISSAFLMIKFYQNMKENHSSVAKALNEAQRWLRDATQQQLLAWANQLNLDKDKITQIEDKLDWYDSDEKPFNSPYHWAAFCAIGQ